MGREAAEVKGGIPKATALMAPLYAAWPLGHLSGSLPREGFGAEQLILVALVAVGRGALKGGRAQYPVMPTH